MAHFQPAMDDGQPVERSSSATMRPWRIWLLFGFIAVAGILNLYDRQVISVLKPIISQDLGWTDDDYGTMAATFQGAAAIAFLFTGWIVDRLGAKWANVVGVTAWSLAAMAHGWATSFGQFVAVRIALGATEAMGTPSLAKAVTTILPPSMRSVGFGLLNAIGSVGAILSPLAIPVIAAFWGWRFAFILGGLLGLAWAVGWLLLTRGRKLQAPPAPPTAASAAPQAEPPAYGHLLTDRRTWAIGFGKILSDSPWWLISYWLADLLHRNFGLSGTQVGVPMAIIFGGGAIGALLAGYGATALLRRDMPLMKVRAICFAFAAACALPLPLVLYTDQLWIAIGLLSLMVAGHQAFSTNLFALIADVVPHGRVGRITSFGAFCGNMGGMVILKLAGVTLMAGLGYLPLFLFAAVSYFAALGVIHLLLRDVRRRVA